MTEKITITSEHFQSLMRNAEHQGEDDWANPENTVTIPRKHHDLLKQTLNEYQQLRSRLLELGYTDSGLDILASNTDKRQEQSGTEHGIQEHAEYEQDWASTSPVPHSTALSLAHWSRASRPEASPAPWRSEGSWRTQPAYDPAVPSPSPSPAPALNTENQHRTIRVLGLPAQTTLKDVAGIVRGGKVLEMGLNPGGRSAWVAFVEGEETAAAFLAYGRRSTIAVHGKIVGFAWADRLTWLHGLALAGLRGGATRNLVIKNAGEEVAEEQLRADLEHIHKLEVVEIKRVGQDVHVSLNGVLVAMYARSCLKSRRAYNNLYIDHDADECARPVVPVSEPAPKPAPKASKPVKSANPFAALGPDDEGEDDEDE